MSNHSQPPVIETPEVREVFERMDGFAVAIQEAESLEFAQQIADVLRTEFALLRLMLAVGGEQ